MKNFLVHSEEVKQDMLSSIKMSTIEDLFKQIPQSARMNELQLEDAISEMEAQKRIKALARKKQ